MRNCDPGHLSDEGWGLDYKSHDVSSAHNRKWYTYPYKTQSQKYPSPPALTPDRSLSATHIRTEWRHNADAMTPFVYSEASDSVVRPCPDAKGYILYCVGEDNTGDDGESDDSDKIKVATPSPRSTRGPHTAL